MRGEAVVCAGRTDTFLDARYRRVKDDQKRYQDNKGYIDSNGGAPITRQVLVRMTSCWVARVIAT